MVLRGGMEMLVIGGLRGEEGERVKESLSSKGSNQIAWDVPKGNTCVTGN